MWFREDLVWALGVRGLKPFTPARIMDLTFSTHIHTFFMH